MKVNYFREMKEHHMIIAAEAHQCPQYQMNMIGRNPITGLLVPVTRLMNGEVLYDYSITGCQSLQTLTELAPISRKMLAKLIVALNQVLEEMERYLVDGDYLALRPEFIYVGMSGDEPVQVKYCFFPFQSQSPEEQMRELLKYVLNEVDYQEKQAVELAYELFQRAAQEDFLIRQLGELVEETQQAEEPEEVVSTVAIPSIESSGAQYTERRRNTGLAIRERGGYSLPQKERNRGVELPDGADAKSRKKLFSGRINRRGREIVLSDILK